MRSLPSRSGLRRLVDAVQPIARAITAGFARNDSDGRTIVFQAHPYGASEYRLDRIDVPAAFLPDAGPIRATSVEVATLRPESPAAWHFRVAGLKTIVSAPVTGFPQTRLWFGLAENVSLDPSQEQAVQAIADSSADLLHAALAPEQTTEELERLELAAGLMPALLDVLDVRDVFDRLSHASQAALPHDMLMLALFSDDLATMTVYAGTGSAAQVGRVLQQPYPAAVIDAWDFDIIDNRAEYPHERDRPPTTLGMLSSLRVSFRSGGRAVGGLAFHSREAAKYTSIDVVVAQRLADLVGIALFHYKMAEEGRRAAAQQARNELIDEVLASITSTGELPDVFERISNAAQKVIRHDALLLAATLPDGRHGKVYASKTPAHARFPDVLQVPPALVANKSWDVDVVDDLHADPAQAQLTVATLGYRAALRVAIRLDNEFAGALSFLSFTPRQYSHTDAPAAKRIAGAVALSFARERGSALLKRADEAAERASKLEARVRALTEELDSRTGYRRVVGESAEWRQVLTQAAQVAATETTALLLGESGTGKEVVARFLHRGSPRKNGPFVALNCAALPEQLLEAELFGYERGAYTGATQSKPGQLEQAAGGTLFLDEVGEMSLPAQAKFLRVLQEREFQRLGGTRVLRSDARVVAATNRDLQRAIANGQFREDLYYRLNVFAIQLPPLRDRRSDILPLSEAFLAEIGRGLGRPPGGISRDARQLLIDYHWPGNVRELRNILERAAILCDGGLITPEHLAINLAPPPQVFAPAAHAATAAAAPPAAAGPPPAPAGDLQSMERAMIEQALQTARFNKSKAAKALGLTRHQLYIRMRKYGFE